LAFDSILIRGIMTTWPIRLPVAISALIMLVLKPKQINLVPLQSPLAGSKFRNVIMGQPIFNRRWWGGKLPDSIYILK
jgi:hypothetical protein